MTDSVAPEVYRFEHLKFGPVGRCIYCGDDGSNDKLRSEHLVPFSLGGNAELLEASCRKCEDVTKRFEQHCARAIFGQFRVKSGVQTRNPKERPKALPVRVTTPGGVE